MSSTLPTKGNLIALKRSLELANTGYELMDRKRNILIREMMRLIDDAKQLQNRIGSTFAEAYAALQAANVTLGISDSIARAVPLDDSINIRYRSVMGVELPSVRTSAEGPPGMVYGFYGTDSMLDLAYIKFNQLKKFTLLLAEVENSVYRLAIMIKKTQKRANALKYVVIPGISADISRVSEALDDKDREDFTRLKVIKSIQTAQKI